VKRPSATEPVHDDGAPAGRPLPRRFYARPSPVLARALLGRLLVHDRADGRVSGRIVEVEAYRGERDPASHAYRGVTPRNRVMFGRAGHAYVYFTYGMHHCVNVVAGSEGVAEAVLVRALAPRHGVDLMRSRRGDVPWERLARGPGCVAAALGLDRKDDGADLVGGALWVSDLAPAREGRRIVATPRIGIRAGVERRWRFVLEGHPCASGPRGIARSVDTRVTAA
jgi:DNA-3-methyladenine glycosylase